MPSDCTFIYGRSVRYLGEKPRYITPTLDRWAKEGEREEEEEDRGERGGGGWERGGRA